jgi:hypothetical protein
LEDDIYVSCSIERPVKYHIKSKVIKCIYPGLWQSSNCELLSSWFAALEQRKERDLMAAVQMIKHSWWKNTAL